MGTFSLWHWLIVGMLALLLFGRGRVSDLMGDVAKGIKSFKRGMAEDDDVPATTTTTTTHTSRIEPPANPSTLAGTPSPIVERHPEPRV